MANTELKRTISSAGSQTKWGASAWVRRCDLGLSAGIYCSSKTDTTQNNRGIFFNSSDQIECAFYNGGYTYQVVTTRLFRDTSAFYHVVVNLDTSQSTAADRIKIWVNGEQITSFGTSNYPSQNSTHNFLGTDITQLVGSLREGSSIHHSCVISHLYFTDGYCYPASTFGSTDATTGEWKINTSPTIANYGTNGFFILKDTNSVTDQSGNSNNLTVSDGTLTFAHDNPSNLFCTLNQNTSKAKPTLSLGNLKTGSSSDGNYVFGTMASKAGYYEIKLGQNPDGGSGSGLTFGTYDANFDDTQTNATNVRMYKTNHAYSASYSIDVGNGAGTNTSVSAAAGDIINVAWKNGKLYCGKNGTYFFSANPSNNTDGSTQVTMADSNAYQLPISKSNVSGMTNSEWNFGNGYFGTTAITTNSGNGYADANGQGKFQYQPPTGCYALCTKNLNV